MFLVCVTGKNGKHGWGSRINSKTMRLVSSPKEAWEYLETEYGHLVNGPEFQTAIRVFEVFADKPPRSLRLAEICSVTPEGVGK